MAHVEAQRQERTEGRGQLDVSCQYLGAIEGDRESLAAVQGAWRTDPGSEETQAPGPGRRACHLPPVPQTTRTPVPAAQSPLEGSPPPQGLPTARVPCGIQPSLLPWPLRPWWPAGAAEHERGRLHDPSLPTATPSARGGPWELSSP